MTGPLTCHEFGRHRKFGLHSVSADGTEGYCSVCSPAPLPPSPPPAPVTSDIEVPKRKPVHITSSTGETDPAVLRRMYGKGDDF